MHCSDDRQEGKLAKAGSSTGSNLAAPLRGHASLPHMPIEVIEIIGKPLSLKERVSLTSCCRALAAHHDMPSSAVLWHTLDIHTQPQPQQQASLAGWLARRRRAVRKLRLEGPCEALGVLASLAGGPLEQLQLQTQRSKGGGGAGDEEEAGGEGVLSMLSTLRELGGLTRLEARGLHLSAGLPCELRALSALLELDLSRSMYNPGSGGGADAGADAQPESPGVRSLALSQLTHLSLSNCGLKALPSELSVLTSLASLDISSNMQLRRGGAGAFGHLRQLHNLRRLDLGQCYLQSLPFELESLTGLRELIASRNHLTLGEGAAAGQAAGAGAGVAWRPLKGLSQLTRLDISCCGLAALPEQLSNLMLLGELAAGSNQLLAYGREAAFAPLQQLAGSLHTLDLSQCELHRLPSTLSTLGSLTRLELSWNGGLGSEAVWAPVGALTALRRLGARGCGLRRRRVPPALKQLKQLREMDLGGAGAAPGWGREGLQHLAVFTAMAKANEGEQERGMSSIQGAS